MAERYKHRGNKGKIKLSEERHKEIKHIKRLNKDKLGNSKELEYKTQGTGEITYKLRGEKQSYSKEEIAKGTNVQFINQGMKSAIVERAKSKRELKRKYEVNSEKSNDNKNEIVNKEILEATASNNVISTNKRPKRKERRCEINKLTQGGEIKTIDGWDYEAGRFKQKDIGIEIDIYSQSDISISSPYISSKNEININEEVNNAELSENLKFNNYVVRAIKLDTSLYRVFNDLELKTGGRFYGAQYQNLSKKERSRILIYDKATGECWPTYEFDFKSLHIRLIYDYKGIKAYGDDYYHLDGIPTELRVLVKLITNILLNSNNLIKAKEAIKKALREDDGLNELFETYRDKSISRSKYITKIINAIKKRHNPVKEYFHSGAGLKLQRIDSDIAEKIVITLMEMNIPCLIVHDSFIVPIQYADILQQIAENAYQEILSCYKSINFLL